MEVSFTPILVPARVETQEDYEYVQTERSNNEDGTATIRTKPLNLGP